MPSVRIRQCKPADQEAKGLVERANGYLEPSFLPGRAFTGPCDFNALLAQRLSRANSRHHRRLGCRPADRIVTDLAAMVALPPVAPVVGWRTSTRLARDHYVRIASNYYSVHPSGVGRLVEVIADLEQVTARCGGQVVARHARCWAAHQTTADPAHVQAAAALRGAPGPHLAGAALSPPGQVQVQQRRLSDYDAALGIETTLGTEQVKG